MDRIDSRPGLPFNGRREMQELALMAQDALEKGGLREEVTLLRERVLERPAADLMDRLTSDDGGGGNVAQGNDAGANGNGADSNGAKGSGASGNAASGERWQMKPMVELLLREIRAVALHPRPIQERRHDIKWLLETAGF